MTIAHDTKTVNGLMAMFYGGAKERGAVVEFERHGRDPMQQFVLTAKQFKWLCDVAQREDGFIPRGPTGRLLVQGEIAGVGGFDASEQKGGAANVLVRMF